MGRDKVVQARKLTACSAMRASSVSWSGSNRQTIIKANDNKGSSKNKQQYTGLRDDDTKNPVQSNRRGQSFTSPKRPSLAQTFSFLRAGRHRCIANEGVFVSESKPFCSGD